jgi:glycosyltransferase involved in cell wall biosynthesis
MLLAGSMGSPADNSNARRFFSGINCRSLDYSPALSEWHAGADPMGGAVPMPASYEDKPGVPDRVFFDLDDAAFDRQVDCWVRFLSSHTTGAPDVVHLHHLTPMHEAVHVLWPDVPLITQLHGTELKMLAGAESEPTANGSESSQRVWVERLRRWAGDSDRVVVAAPHDERLVQQLLPVDSARVATIVSGVDTEVFSPRPRTHSQRLAMWRRCLVEEPRGWQAGRPEGSIRYSLGDLSAFTDPEGQPVPVILFAGRFMKFKRLQLLIEAHHVTRSTTGCRSVLVVAGGFPREWEGEHPYDTVRRLGAVDVFFAGWQDHDELANMLNCSDVFAAPAVDEPFGLVYLEAMASGIPPIATNTGGPRSFINVDPGSPTGWLVPPDDVAATARALVDAVSNRAEREQRGRRASQFILDHYSWATSAKAFAKLYEEVSDAPRRSTGSQRELSMSSHPELPTTGVA